MCNEQLKQDFFMTTQLLKWVAHTYTVLYPQMNDNYDNLTTQINIYFLQEKVEFGLKMRVDSRKIVYLLQNVSSTRMYVLHLWNIILLKWNVGLIFSTVRVGTNICTRREIRVQNNLGQTCLLTKRFYSFGILFVT